MKKIWIVSEVFYPETVATAYIMTEIAKYLTLENNVNVIRTSNKGYNKNSIISRVIGSFMVSYERLVLSR